ncbi:MAG: hypothetical protein NT165_02115 [Candidatus Falkowbacteria bacterium]|nr:hypothetical protein [Candidatus Falkowbacteria bacterium]
MEIIGPSGHNYVVGDNLSDQEGFKLYACRFGENEACILKIAKKVAFNGLLDKEAFLLEEMKKSALALEEFHQKNSDGKYPLNCHFFFPELVETFISPEQGNSRINILSFSHIAENLSSLSKIRDLSEEEKIRVDPKTSAWILGRMLKLLSFTHGQHILIGALSGSNILINRKGHHIAILDWAKAKICNGEVPKDLAAEEISALARETLILLGASQKTGELLPDKQLVDDKYEKMIQELLFGKIKDSVEAHQKFYEVIRSIWPSEFHKFTSYRI